MAGKIISGLLRITRKQNLGPARLRVLKSLLADNPTESESEASQNFVS